MPKGGFIREKFTDERSAARTLSALGKALLTLESEGG
jgi:hypothetical protein